MLRFLLVLLVCLTAVGAVCDGESDMIECKSSTRCTRLHYVCDDDNDCGDFSDEGKEMCHAWRNIYCPRGEAPCNRSRSMSCVPISDYCNDLPDCESGLDRRICQMLKDKKLNDLDSIILPEDMYGHQDVPGRVEISANLNQTFRHGNDFMSVVPDAIKNDDCPQLYTRIGEECVSFFFFGNMTWGESQKFCELIGGDLYVPKQNADFDRLARHLRAHSFEADFWIGGNFYNNTVGWTWLNKKSIELESNHWALIHNNDCVTRSIKYQYRSGNVPANKGVCYKYFQTPYVSDPYGSCVALTYEYFYFMSDEDCNQRRAPLCQLSSPPPSSVEEA